MGCRIVWEAGEKYTVTRCLNYYADKIYQLPSSSLSYLERYMRNKWLGLVEVSATSSGISILSFQDLQQ